MPKPARKPQKIYRNFDKPEDFPIEVRAHVVAIKITRQTIVLYKNLFENLPDFLPLHDRLDELSATIDGIASFINQYLDEEFDFDLFEYEMVSSMAEEIQSELDNYPCFREWKHGDRRKNSSPLEYEMFSEMDDLMIRVWDVVRDEGYKLYNAMLRQ